jgi:COP9 signalosome complex subunit 1
LGNWLRDCGQLSDALKCYTRTREFCSTSEHVVEMCLGVIEVSSGASASQGMG